MMWPPFMQTRDERISLDVCPFDCDDIECPYLLTDAQILESLLKPGILTKQAWYIRDYFHDIASAVPFHSRKNTSS